MNDTTSYDDAASHAVKHRSVLNLLRVSVMVTLIVAAVALVLAVSHAGDVSPGTAGRIAARIAAREELKGRRESAKDSCHLLVGLVYAATTKAPKQRKAAAAYIAITPLRNCTLYAQQVVKAPVTTTK